MWLLLALPLQAPTFGPRAPNAPRLDAAPTPGPVDEAAFVEAFDEIDPALWQAGTWRLGLTQLGEEALRLRAGALELHLQRRDGGWRGAELFRLASATEGRFEASLQVPDVPGSVCAFFLYGTDEAGLVDEIDVELLSARPQEVWFGTYAGWAPADGYGEGPTRASFVWSDPDFDHRDWHRYGIEWRADRVAFFVDGVEVGAVSVSPRGAAAPRVNHWTTDTWGEVAGPPRADATCRVDDVVLAP